MALLNLYISLFLFLTITLPIYAKKPCKPSNCSTSGPEIKFPFLLKDLQDESCGYPGFNLTCSNQGKVAIDFPSSGRFFIREINYETQIIKFYDPDNCLPGRIMGLNLSGSPFTGYPTNFSFFSCPVNFTSYKNYTIDCLTNSTNNVILVNNYFVTSYMRQSCVEMATISVPFVGIDRDLNEVTLTWDRPQCGSCESTGGVCVLRSVGSQDADCLYPRKVLKALMIIFLSTVIPTSVIISCCWLMKKCLKENHEELNDSSTHITFGSLATPPQSSTTTSREGLDESTIQSYPKVIIGENNLSPGLNNKTCPICLYEFLAKETVRFIPNCTHCFHSDCIDKWLRLNHSCPVCRISLTRVNI